MCSGCSISRQTKGMKKKKLWLWGPNGRFYQYLLNYENPHLSLKAAGHIYVFHLQAPISKVMHHYAKWSIVVTLIKSSTANTTLLQNNSTNRLLPLCKSKWSAKGSYFPVLVSTSLKAADAAQRAENEISLRFTFFLHEVTFWQRWDVTVTSIPTSELPMMRILTHFVKMCSKWLSAKKTNKLYESLSHTDTICGCNPRGKIGKIIK